MIRAYKLTHIRNNEDNEKLKTEEQKLINTTKKYLSIQLYFYYLLYLFTCLFN